MGNLYSSLVVKRSHIVLFSYEAWGHIRPLCNLAARLAKARPVYITLFTTSNYYDRVRTELLRNFEPHELRKLESIRLVCLAHKSVNPLDSDGLEDEFAENYRMLVRSQSVQCSQTSARFPPIPSPDAVVIDSYGLSPFETVRAISEKPVKVFMWFGGSASSIFRFCVPKKYGGIGDLRAKAEYEADRSGTKIEEAACDIALGNTGCTVYIPGLPPLYDHEIQPQHLLGTKAQIGTLMLGAHDVVNACDGILLSSPVCYEGEAINALKQWLAETSRSVYAFGPLVPYGYQADAVEGQSVDATQVISFLDSTREKKGDHSVLFISFGTVYWPLEPEKLVALLDAAIEKQIPFILNHASPYIPIPEFIVEKVKGYAGGIVTEWCPQQLILGHPAIGWFLTHGGQNSVTEALRNGVPMICWPFSFDQALNAARLSEGLSVAYELFQVRNGRGLKIAHRLGKIPEGTVEVFQDEVRSVLGRAFGEDGEQKRRNILKLNEAMAQSWSKKGPSTLAVAGFLDSLDDHSFLSWL